MRCHFEISAEAIVTYALSRLAKEGKFDAARAQAAFREFGLDPDSPDPARA